MRKLIYFIAVTADGYIAADDGSFDFFPMSGEHLPYIFREYPETIPGHLRSELGVRGENRNFDTVLMGRHTYEVGLSIGVVSPYPHLRQILVSSTLCASPHPAVELVSQNPAERVRSLKQEEGLDIWLCGGAVLAGALREEIDEIILKINPVVLGAGKPLFRGAAGPKKLQLKDYRKFSGGVVIHRYAVK